MTTVHGKNTVVTVDGNDLSAYTNSSEFKEMSDKHEKTCYGANAKGYAGGLTDATFTMGGIYDSTAAGPRAIIQPLIGTTVTVVRRPEGTGSTLPQDSASMLVENYVETNPAGGLITWSADFQVDGDVDSTDQV